MYLFTMPMNKAKKTAIFAAALATALALAAVAAARTDDTSLSLVAYSTPKTVMGSGIAPPRLSNARRPGLRALGTAQGSRKPNIE